MPLAKDVQREILDRIAQNFESIVLVKDPTNALSVGTATVGISSYQIDGVKSLVWANAVTDGGTGAVSKTTTNSAISSPINFSVPKDSVPNKLVLYGGGTAVIEAIFPLNTPVPIYTAGDGAYYVRGILLNSTEV